MATLDDLKIVLESIDNSMMEQKDLLTTMISMQETRDRLASVDTSVANPNAGAGQGIGAAAASGVGAGIGVGVGAAAGLIGMGAGIAGFMAALSVGSMGLDWLGSDYSGLGEAFASFSDAITNLSPGAMVALAGAATIAAGTSSFKNLYGLGTASGMVGLGAGISGFLIGLSLGEIGLSWIGNDYTNLGGALASFSDAISGLTLETVTLFGGIAGIAIANTALGGNPKSLAANMTGLAAGIAGFLGGLVLADIGIGWITSISGADGSGLKSAFKLFNDSVGELKDPIAITALGAILTAGTAAGIAKGGGGVGTGIGIAATMTGIGAGIAGLMAGLVGGGVAIDWINKASGLDSGALVGAFKLFNDSVGALNNENAIKALGAIILAGTAAGLLTNAGGAGAGVGIAAVMTGIGAGISGLFIGLALGGKVVDAIESIGVGDGDGLVSIFRMFNDSIVAITPDAIDRLKDLVALGGIDLVGVLGGLSAGVVAMFAAEGLVGLGQTIKDGVLGTIDFIFGSDLAQQKNPSVFQQMVDGLEPIKNFDIAPINEFVTTLDTLTSAFERLSNIETGNGIQKNIFSMMKNLGGVMGIMPFLLRGGYYRGDKAGYGDNIDFGPEGEGGLLALRDEDLELLKKQVSKLYSALDISGVNVQGGNGGDVVGTVTPAAPTATAAPTAAPTATQTATAAPTATQTATQTATATVMGNQNATKVAEASYAMVAGRPEVPAVPSVPAVDAGDAKPDRLEKIYAEQLMWAEHLERLDQITNGEFKPMPKPAAVGETVVPITITNPKIDITSATILSSMMNNPTATSPEYPVGTVTPAIPTADVNKKPVAVDTNAKPDRLEKIYAEQLMWAEHLERLDQITNGEFRTVPKEVAGRPEVPSVAVSETVVPMTMTNSKIDMTSANLLSSMMTNPIATSPEYAYVSGMPEIAQNTAKMNVFESAVKAVAESPEISAKPYEQTMQEERDKANTWLSQAEALVDTKKEQNTNNVNYSPVTDASSKTYVGGTTNTTIISPRTGNDLNYGIPYGVQ